VPLISKITKKAMKKWKMKWALFLSPKLRKFKFSKIETDVSKSLSMDIYENEQFRLYLQEGGIILTSVDRDIYRKNIGFMEDDFVDFSIQKSLSLEIMIPRQFQMMIGPLPFVRVGTSVFEQDWGLIQLSSANSQLDGILHSFVIPSTSFVYEEYPDEFISLYMAFLNGEISEENKRDWLEKNEIFGELNFVEGGIQYSKDEIIWEK
jgi:hypothetical protein